MNNEHMATIDFFNISGERVPSTIVIEVTSFLLRPCANLEVVFLIVVGNVGKVAPWCFSIAIGELLNPLTLRETG